VLDEECNGEKKCCDHHASWAARRTKNCDKSPDGDGMTQQLRIVHCDIVACQEETGDEKERCKRGLGRGAAHEPGSAQYSVGQDTERQQRDEPTGDDRIPGEARNFADEIERQRGIVVDEQSARWRIGASRARRQLSKIGVPAFVGIERNLKTNNGNCMNETSGATKGKCAEPKRKSCRSQRNAHERGHFASGEMS